MSATKSAILGATLVLVAVSPGIAQRGTRPAYDLVTQDYDGDKKADFALRLKDGRWLIDYARNGLGGWDASIKERSPGGTRTARPCPKDYDGDGKADIAIFLRTHELCIDYAKNGFGKWDVIRSYSVPNVASDSGPGRLARVPATTGAANSTRSPRDRAAEIRDRVRSRGQRSSRSARARRARTTGESARRVATGKFPDGDIDLIVNGLNHEVQIVLVTNPVSGRRRVVNGSGQSVTIRLAKTQRLKLTVNGLSNRVSIPRALINNVTAKVNGQSSNVRYTR